MSSKRSNVDVDTEYYKNEDFVYYNNQYFDKKDTKEKNIDKIIKKKIIKAQKPIKEDAMVRNIKFLLITSLFWNFIVNLFLVGLFAYLEISIERYDQSTLFNILDTILLSVYLVIFYGVKLIIFFVLTKRQQEKIYERRLVENIKDQATIDYFLPIPTIIIFFLSWKYQINFGSDNNGFNTPIGIFYSMLCMVKLAMSMLSIFIIITCSFSYYRPYIPPSSVKYITNEPWVSDKFFHVSEENKGGKKTLKIEYN